MRRVLWTHCVQLWRAWSVSEVSTGTDAHLPMAWSLAAVGTVVALDNDMTPSRTRADVAPLSEDPPPKQSRWKNFSLLDLETRRRTFFNYEKRIRSLSSPEKVFEYFSSIEHDGVKFMTEEDLLKALVPVYPPEESILERGGSLMGENVPQQQAVAFLNVFDLDGDSLISYHEYLMVLTFLSIPIVHIEVVFDIVDKDKNGYIDKDEFQVVLDHIKGQSRQARLSRGGLRTGLNVGGSDESDGLLVKFFGKDGKEKLDLPELRAFLEDLQHKLLILEFLHYDFRNRGSIDGKDFARSAVAGTEMSHSSQYLKKIAKMDEELASTKISREAFMQYYSLIRHLSKLETALTFIESSQGASAITSERFQDTVERVTGIDLNEAVVQICFFLFTDNSRRPFNIRYFLATLEGRVKH